MASSNSIIPILFMALVILQPILGFELLNSICSPTSARFASVTQYKTNLKTLLKLLTSQPTFTNTGFSTGSSGQPGTQRAYGLINCLSNVSSSTCTACGSLATKAAQFLCPGNQAAVLWYDSCILKYSDFDFLGKIDTNNQFTFKSSERSVSPNKFGSRVVRMMNKLIEKAVGGPEMFALRRVKMDLVTRVYVMVECTKDLSSEDCGVCLREIVGEFYECCSGVKGGRVVAASCMFRFEFYPFL